MGAKMIDIQTMIQAGIDPKTKMPTRLDLSGEEFKNNFRRVFRIIDEQDAVNRYKWFNLPCDLSSEELERLIYYKGQLCFFYFKDLGRFYILPYALDGTIDFYGRFNSVHPIPFAIGTTEEERRKGMSESEYQNFRKMETLLSTLHLTVIKDPVLEEDLTEDMLDNCCVLLHDYTKQLSQNIIPRQQLNDCFTDLEAEILPYLSTALLAGSGVRGLRVNDADASEEATRASAQIRNAALTRKMYVAMTSPNEMQDLADGTPLKGQEYLLALQGIDNIRKSSLGIENGGIFQKKAHKLESEQTGNESSVATVYQDGLSIRQHFCNIVNSIWGTEIWCEPSEAVLGQDINGDGVAYDRDAGVSPAQQEPEPQQQGGEE